MPHNPTHRRTLLDIFSKGKYKTSKELPEIKEKIMPALEFMTGATHVPKGQKVDPKNLAFALPFIGKVGRTASKAKWGINRMLKVAEKGQKPRSVVAVQMKKGGEEWLQPFYKSTGTSVSASKKGKWFPFMGKQQTAGGRFYKDTAGEAVTGSGKGWFIKGWSTGKDKWKLAGGKGYDPTRPTRSAMGPYGSVSKEISRLEKTGYFKHAGTATSGRQINMWLEGYGYKRPRSVSW